MASVLTNYNEAVLFKNPADFGAGEDPQSTQWEPLFE